MANSLPTAPIRPTMPTEPTYPSMPSRAATPTEPTQVEHFSSKALSSYEKWLIEYGGPNAKGIVWSRKQNPNRVWTGAMQGLQEQAQANERKLLQQEYDRRYSNYYVDIDSSTQINSLVDAVLGAGNNAMDLALGDTGRAMNNWWGPTKAVGWVANALANSAKLAYKSSSLEIAINETYSVLSGRRTMAEAFDNVKRNAFAPSLGILWNIGETMDVLRYPVSGFTQDGWEGLVRATVGDETGRNNYNADTGSLIGDIAVEILQDPLTWFSLGGLAKGFIKPLTAAGKEVAENVAEEAAQQATKTVVQLTAEATMDNVIVESFGPAGRRALKYVVEAGFEPGTKEYAQAASKRIASRIYIETGKELSAESIEKYINSTTKGLVKKGMVRNISEYDLQIGQRIKKSFLDALGQNTDDILFATHPEQFRKLVGETTETVAKKQQKKFLSHVLDNNTLIKVTQDLSDAFFNDMTATVMGKIGVYSKAADNVVSGLLLKSVLYTSPVAMGVKLLVNGPVSRAFALRSLRKSADKIVGAAEGIQYQTGIVDDILDDITKYYAAGLLDEMPDAAQKQLIEYTAAMQLEVIKGLIQKGEGMTEIMKILRVITNSVPINTIDDYINFITSYAPEIVDDFVQLKVTMEMVISASDLKVSREIAQSKLDVLSKHMGEVHETFYENFARNDYIIRQSTKALADEWEILKSLRSERRILQEQFNAGSWVSDSIEFFTKKSTELDDLIKVSSRRIDELTEAKRIAIEAAESNIAKLRKEFLPRWNDLKSTKDGILKEIRELEKSYKDLGDEILERLNYISEMDFHPSDTVNVILNNLNELERNIAFTGSSLKSYENIRTVVKDIAEDIDLKLPINTKRRVIELNELMQAVGDPNSLEFKAHWPQIKRLQQSLVRDSELPTELKQMINQIDLSKVTAMQELYMTESKEMLMRISDTATLNIYNNNEVIKNLSTRTEIASFFNLPDYNRAQWSFNKLQKKLEPSMMSVFAEDAGKRFDSIFNVEEYLDDLAKRFQNRYTQIDPEFQFNSLNTLAKKHNIPINHNTMLDIAEAQSRVLQAEGKAHNYSIAFSQYNNRRVTEIALTHLDEMGELIVDFTEHIDNFGTNIQEWDMLQRFYDTLNNLPNNIELKSIMSTYEDTSNLFKRITAYSVDQGTDIKSVNELFKGKNILLSDYVQDLAGGKVLSQAQIREGVEAVHTYMLEMNNLNLDFYARHGRTMRMIEAPDTQLLKDFTNMIELPADRYPRYLNSNVEGKIDIILKADPSDIKFLNPSLQFNATLADDLKKTLSELAQSINGKEGMVKEINAFYRAVPVPVELFTDPALRNTLMEIQAEVAKHVTDQAMRELLLTHPTKNLMELLNIAEPNSAVFTNFRKYAYGQLAEMDYVRIPMEDLNNQSIITVRHWIDTVRKNFNAIENYDDILALRNQVYGFLSDTQARYERSNVYKLGVSQYLNSTSLANGSRIMQIPQDDPLLAYAMAKTLAENYVTLPDESLAKRSFKKIFNKYTELFDYIETGRDTFKVNYRTGQFKLDSIYNAAKATDLELLTSLSHKTDVTNLIKNIEEISGIEQYSTPVRDLLSRYLNTFDDAGLPTKKTQEFIMKSMQVQNKMANLETLVKMGLTTDEIGNYIIANTGKAQFVTFRLAEDTYMATNKTYIEFITAKKKALIAQGFNWIEEDGRVWITVGEELKRRLRYDTINQMWSLDGNHIPKMTLRPSYQSLDILDDIRSFGDTEDIIDVYKNIYTKLWEMDPDMAGGIGIRHIPDIYNGAINTGTIPKAVTELLDDVDDFGEAYANYNWGSLGSRKELMPTIDTTALDSVNNNLMFINNHTQIKKQFIDYMQETGIALDNELFRGMSRAEIVEYLNTSDEWVGVFLSPNKNLVEGVELKTFNSLNVRNFDDAIKANLRIMPYTTYQTGFMALNKYNGHNPVLKAWAGIMKWYKLSYLSLSPGLVLRNFLDSFMKLNLENDNDIYRSGSNYVEAVRLNRQYKKTMEAIKKMDPYGKFRHSNMDAYFKSAAPKYMDRELYEELYTFFEKAGWNSSNIEKSLIDKVVNKLPTMQLNNWVEEQVRLAQYLSMTDEGLSQAGKIHRIIQTQFNYMTKSPTTKRIENYLPFYHFHSSNIMYLLQVMDKHPAAYRGFIQNFLRVQDIDGYDAEELRSNTSLLYNITAGNVNLSRLLGIQGEQQISTNQWGTQFEGSNDINLKVGLSMFGVLEAFVNPVKYAEDNLSILVSSPIGYAKDFLINSYGNNETGYQDTEQEAKQRQKTMLERVAEVSPFIPFANVLVQQAQGAMATAERTGIPLAVAAPLNTVINSTKRYGERITNNQPRRSTYSKRGYQSYRSGGGYSYSPRNTARRTQYQFNKIARPPGSYNKYAPPAYRLAKSRMSRPLTGNFRPNVNMFRPNATTRSYASYIHSLLGYPKGRMKLHNWNARELTQTRYHQASNWSKRYNKNSFGKISTKHYQFNNYMRMRNRKLPYRFGA